MVIDHGERWKITNKNNTYLLAMVPLLSQMLHAWNIHKFKPNVRKYSIHGAYGYVTFPECTPPKTNVTIENPHVE